MDTKEENFHENNSDCFITVWIGELGYVCREKTK